MVKGCKRGRYGLGRAVRSTHAGLNFSEFKIFKISLFAQGACYYFGIRGVSERLAEEEKRVEGHRKVMKSRSLRPLRGL